MNKHQMIKLNLGFATLFAGIVATAQAADYPNLYFFGDSLTDSGAYGPILNIAPNSRFTTNPGTVWAEDLGARYGRSVTPAYAASLTPAGFQLIANGNNFAVGSARVNAPPDASVNSSPVLAPLVPLIPSVSSQVTDFLARGALDPRALYAISGGPNDIFTQLNTAVSPDAGKAAIVTAANDLLTQVTRLQSAGARNLIALSLMDISKTPFGLSLTPDKTAQLNSLMQSFDTTLTAGLAGKNLLYFDTRKLLNTLIANPSAYGITNTTDAAVPTSLGHVPAPSTDGYLFADLRHPSARYHKILSDWVYTSLEAGSRASLLSMLPLQRSGTQWLTIDSRLQRFQNFGSKGQGFFISGDYASYSIDSGAGLPSGDSKGAGFVLGYEKAFTSQMVGGMTLSYGHNPFDLGNNQGSLKMDEWALAAFASHKFGAFYANALASYSWLDFESNRNVVLGPFNSSESGNTRGDQFGVRGQIGYNFVIGNIVHGPIAGLTWERVTVNGFNERSGTLTAMSFGDQARESLRSRFGWQTASEIKWSSVKLRPVVQLTYDFQHLKDEQSYRVGFVGGPTSMDFQTANRTGGYGTLLAGLNVDLNERISLGVNGSTTISQPGANNAAINAMLGVSF